MSARSRFLERALFFSLLIHALAMLSMALLLLPGMPGSAADPVRVRYVASHPWLWRLGWFPWQLTALSDLLIGVGLLRATWIPRGAAVLTVLVTCAAVLIDQSGEILWITRGVALAQTGDVTGYLLFERTPLLFTGGWGDLFYTCGAVGWTWCLAKTGAWNRWLTWISFLVWPVFFALAGAAFLPDGAQLPGSVTVALNGVGFALLEVWLALALEEVLRRTHPDATHGRWAPWRYPGPFLAKILDPLANSRFVRYLTALLPVPAFVSDISDVLYVNYVVPAERLVHLVPPGLELQRVGPGGQFGVFTFLSYRHGHLGPRLLGPLRRFMPSPIHTNWRIHVRDPHTGKLGIYFVTNAISNVWNALGARSHDRGHADALSSSRRAVGLRRQVHAAAGSGSGQRSGCGAGAEPLRAAGERALVGSVWLLGGDARLRGPSGPGDVNPAMGGSGHASGDSARHPARRLRAHRRAGEVARGGDHCGRRAALLLPRPGGELPVRVRAARSAGPGARRRARTALSRFASCRLMASSSVTQLSSRSGG